MKREYALLFLFVIAGITSCQKASINGKLDGMWQLTSIEYKNKPAETPDQLYYCIQLHMIYLQGSYDCFGSFSHQGDSIHIIMRECKTWDDNDLKIIRACRISDIAVYGMNDTIQSFGIENLGTEKMTLNSSYARLQFRKF